MPRKKDLVEFKEHIRAVRKMDEAIEALQKERQKHYDAAIEYMQSKRKSNPDFKTLKVDKQPVTIVAGSVKVWDLDAIESLFEDVKILKQMKRHNIPLEEVVMPVKKVRPEGIEELLKAKVLKPKQVKSLFEFQDRSPYLIYKPRK